MRRRRRPQRPRVTLWLTCRVYAHDPARRADGESGWEIMGLFSTEEGAKAACSQPWDLIGPIVLDEKLPDEATIWSGAYYPLWRAQ